MPYKNNEDRKKKSLEYYYKNKEKVLEYQKKRWKEKYAVDKDFRKKRQLRDKSRKDKTSLEGESCLQCFSTIDLQRHHPNYKSIEFIILCRSCHNKLHESLRREKLQSITIVNSVVS